MPLKRGGLATTVSDGGLMTGVLTPGQGLADDTVAVLEVVSMQVPVAVGGPHTTTARPSALRSADPATDRDFVVLRPVRFAVERLLRGDLPGCVDLDVVGGSTADYASEEPGLPADLEPGDRVLALLRDSEAYEMRVADEQGAVVVPYGTERIDLDTWTPPPPRRCPRARRACRPTA